MPSPPTATTQPTPSNHSSSSRRATTSSSPGLSCPSFPPSLIAAAVAAADPHSHVKSPRSPSPPPLARRHNTVTLSGPPPAPLPLLDFSSLSKSNPVSSANAARDHIDAIATSLSAVRPYLYVGGLASLLEAQHKQTAAAAAITHVVTFTTMISPQLERYQKQHASHLYHHRHHQHQHQHQKNLTITAFPLRDDVQQCIEHVFLPVAHIIDDARAHGGTVALICAQGISRSATCALAYLVLRDGLSVEQAMTDARTHRPIIAPNAAFLEALHRLERKVRHGLSKDTVCIVKQVTEKPNSNHSYNHSHKHHDRDVTMTTTSPTKRHVVEGSAVEKLLHGRTTTPLLSTTSSTSSLTSTSKPVQKPYVAIPKHHFNAPVAARHVVVVERAARNGVLVWLGRESEREEQLAGQRLARVIARQQTADARRFGGHGTPMRHIKINKSVGTLKGGGDAGNDEKKPSSDDESETQLLAPLGAQLPIADAAACGKVDVLLQGQDAAFDRRLSEELSKEAVR